ncbi:hypothetical protein EV361DRAFT_957065 [Lentinula raphanica]|nr:hypothetical protein EV361DRAFT_957065 [Lentinula raphanica]
MLRSVDDVPNAPILRWISWIRLFDFELNHVPADQFKAEDGLSRRRPSPEDEPYDDVTVDEFLEAYNDSAHRALDLAKFSFDELYYHYSNPFIQSWGSGTESVPLLSVNEDFESQPKFGDVLLPAPFHSSDDYSFMSATASRQIESNPSRRLPEFYYRSYMHDSISTASSSDKRSIDYGRSQEWYKRSRR